jgi:hypothetical protein
MNGKRYLIEVENMEEAVEKLIQHKNPEKGKDMGSYGNTLVKSKFNVWGRRYRQLFNVVLLSL